MISFIIPVLNGDKFIGRCLEHIFREKAATDEIIVVDNGSTDRTLDIIQNFQGIRIFQKSGATIAALRNFGASHARHDIFAFIDSDCLLCSGWRNAALAQLASKHIHATGSLYRIPEDSTWIERAWFSTRVKEPIPVHYIVSGNLVVKRTAFTSVQGFNESLETDEDSDFGIRLNYSGFVVVEDPHVAAIHLGNPKSLKQFFHKVCWHSKGGSRLFISKRLDKPMLMTIAFACSIFIALFSALSLSGTITRILIPIFMLISVPIFSSVYRAVQFKNQAYFVQLTVLHLIYFSARLIAIFQKLTQNLKRR